MVNYYAEYIDSVITAVDTKNIECEVSQSVSIDELEEPELKQIIDEIDALEKLEELTDIQYIDKEQILNNEIIVKDSVEFIDSMYDFDNIEYLDNEEDEIIEEIIVPKQFDVDLSQYEEQIQGIMQFNEALEEKANEYAEEYIEINQNQDKEVNEETNIEEMSSEADFFNTDTHIEEMSSEADFFNTDTHIEESSSEEDFFNTDTHIEESSSEEDFFNIETDTLDEVIDFKPRIKQDTEMNLNEELDLFSEENADENSDYAQEKDPFDFEETAFSVEENKLEELEQNKVDEFKDVLSDAVKETFGITEETNTKPIKFDSPNVSKFDEYVYNAIINFHNKLFRIPKSFKNIFAVA